MSFEDIVQVYKQELNWSDPDLLYIIHGTALANRLGGDPAWLFVVGPSGSGKTEALRPFKFVSEAFWLDTLSENSLISGYRGHDQSLLPKLNRKVLILKDMSSILSLNPLKKNQIIGDLRGAYDGDFCRATGMGVKRYDSKFGLIAGAVPRIEQDRILLSQLGERFVYVTNYHKVTRINANLDRVRKHLGKLAVEFYARITIDGQIVPLTKDEATLAMLVCQLRTPVDRDPYNKEVLSIPTPEAPSRFLLQLDKIKSGLQALNATNIAQCVIRIIVDNIPSIRLAVLRLIEEGKAFHEIKDKIPVSSGQLRRTLHDLELLGATISNPLTHNEHYYKLTFSPQVLVRTAEGGNNLAKIVSSKTSALGQKGELR